MYEWVCHMALIDIDDVQRILPGYTFAIYEWLRTYKMPTGKPANEFAFNGEAKNRDYALQVIEENHHFWRRLITGEVPNKTERYNTATYVGTP
jgi:inorganic pyrophosphatase